MIRESFAMRIRPGMERAFSRLYEAVPQDVLAAWRHMGLANQSVWRVEDWAYSVIIRGIMGTCRRYSSWAMRYTKMANSPG